MFKKFMSYLLTFALLHSNAAWAGNGSVFGMLDLEEDDAHSSPIAIPQKSQNEKTPLKPIRRDPLPNPQFQSLRDLSTVAPQYGNIQGNSSVFPLEDELMNSSGSKAIAGLSAETNDDDKIPDVTGINFQEIAAKGNLPQPLQTHHDIKKSTNPSFISPAGDEKDSSEGSPRPSSESSPPLTSSSPEREHHHIPLQKTTLDLSSSGDGSGTNVLPPVVANPGDEDSDSADPDIKLPIPKVKNKDKNDGANVEQPFLEQNAPAELKNQNTGKPARIEVSGDGPPLKPRQPRIEVSGTGPADRPLQPINSNHELIPLGDGDDPEDGWGKLVSPITDDPSLQAVFNALLHLHYLIEGKPTTRQMLIGGIVGPLIGIGVGNAMPPILMKSLDDLGQDFIDTMTNNDLAVQLFISHTAITLGIDAIARNVRILAELAGPSTEEFSVPKTKTMKNLRRGLLAFIYGGAGTAALLPVYLLWDSEKEHLEKHPEDRNIGLTYFGCLSLPLFLDACLLVSHAAKSWMDEKINNYCIRQAYTAHPSLKIRSNELSRFKELAHLFADMNDVQIRTPYEAIYAQGLHRTKYASLLSEEQLKILDVLHTLKALQNLYPNGGHDSEFMIQEADNWRTTSSTLLSYGIPLAASVGRSMVFWYVVDDLLSSLGLPSGPSKDFLSILGGELVAALFQGILELNTSKKALSDILYTGEEEETSHNPWWKTCRIIGKGYTYLQGAWNTLPYMLVGAKVTGFWPSWTRIVTLLPFGIADTFNNSMNFQEAYGDVIGATESVAAHYGKVTPGYMRKTLIGLANKCHELYDILDPQVMSGLHTTFLKYEKLLEALTKLDQPSHSLFNKEPTGEKK